MKFARYLQETQVFVLASIWPSLLTKRLLSDSGVAEGVHVSRYPYKVRAF